MESTIVPHTLKSSNDRQPSEENAEDSLGTVIRGHLAKHKQDYELAIPSIVKEVRKSADLTEKAIWVAVRYLARGEVSLFRARMQHEEAEQKSSGSVNIHSKSNGSPKPAAVPVESRRVINDRILTETGGWYDWPLPGNRGPIGDATRPIMEGVVEFYDVQEKGMKKKRLAYSQITEKLRGDKKVREVFPAAQLAKLLGGLQ